MKKIFIVFALVLAAVLITACTPLFEVELYNNTGENITVVAINSASNATTHIIKNGEAVELGSPFKLEVQQADRIWQYDIKRIPLSFHRRVGHNVHLVKIQIQSDGSIYLLLPDATKGPVVTFPPQPGGYPIHPIP
jgi:hypothetical protein